MKKILKWILRIVLLVLVALLCYVGYIFVDYHRMDDNVALEVNDRVEGEERVIERNREYEVLSFNIGFGAYEPDFGFFMDGGTESWAWSMQRLDRNLTAIADFLKKEGADFYLIQEVDIDATRTYHFDERAFLRQGLPDYNFVFALNYDSSFLFYPLIKPIGKSKSGIMTFSAFEIESAVRRSLPIETGVAKLLDLDRCYAKCRIPLEDGGTLLLYNLHLSAYTLDGGITFEQMQMLINDMQYEYSKGNVWCIAGGDFNKDFAGVGSVPFPGSEEIFTWSQNMPDSLFEGTSIQKVSPFDPDNPVASCRNADGPYNPSQYQIIIDGFMVSPNVETVKAEVLDTGYAYSDHNPVRLKFVLR